MGPGGSVAGPYGRAVFLIALRRRIRVDSALRAREQAMVTFAIAFWGFWVTVSRGGSGGWKPLFHELLSVARGGGWKASVPWDSRVQEVSESRVTRTECANYKHPRVCMRPYGK